MSDTRSPVQGAELWVPNGEVLELRGGAYGPHTEFARVSGRTRFRRGEGLPGAVWATEQTLLWRDLSAHFVRGEYAATAGIDAAIGLPWFRGRELAGVVTLLLTASASAAACVEIWNHDDRVDVLRHGGGLYPHAAELEHLSAMIQFPYGAGLPGLAWSTGMPVVIDDVGGSNEFVRAEPAARLGLKRGLAVPLFRERRVAHVLALLGTQASAFPLAFELFVEGEVGLVTKASSEAGNRDSQPPSSTPRARRLLAQEARSSRMPSVTPAAAVASRYDWVSESGASILLTLPVHDGARLRGVICLEF